MKQEILSRLLNRERIFFMHTLQQVDARSGGEGGCNSGENRDKDVQDFVPKGFVFHSFYFK